MIRSCPVPDASLLAAYRDAGAYADCYVTRIDSTVTLARFVAAFYTTPVFKLERWILRWAIARPSTDAQAQQVAAGTIDAFSAWRVEGRAERQLLMCDVHGRTRSWFMVAPAEGSDGAHTCLYFGSAVVPLKHPKSGTPTMGGAFRMLLGFHRIYSIVLLRAARSRLSAASRS